MRNVRQLLASKPAEIHSIAPDAPVIAALRLMAEKGVGAVLDVRAIGLLCAVELEPRPGFPGARGSEVAQWCFDNGVLVRGSGDTIVISPPLVISPQEIAQVFDTLASALKHVA